MGKERRTVQPLSASAAEQPALRPALWAGACFCLFLLLYSLTSRADVQVSDEAAILATGVALDTNGVLYVDSLQWLQDSVNIGQVGNGQHLYAKYFPGNVLGSALLYRLAALPNDRPYIWGTSDFGYHVIAPSQAGVHFALRLNAWLGALGMTMLFLQARRLYGLSTAILTALLIGVGSDWWYQSRGFFSELGAGALMMSALYFADAEKPYWCSLALGISLLFRPTNLLAVPIWIYSLQKRKPSDLLAGLFLVAGLAALAYYNWLRFGSAMDFGYGSEAFKASILVGLAGALFSPGRSLFLYSPILVMAILGGRWTYTADKRRALLMIGVAGSYILAVAAWQTWWGGKAWGSRLLTPVVPLLGVLVAATVDRALRTRAHGLMSAIAILGTAGLGVQLLTLTANPVVVLDSYLNSGYATYAESILSPSKNWLALQLRNLPNTSPCTIDAYSLRTLFAQCR